MFMRVAVVIAGSTEKSNEIYKRFESKFTELNSTIDMINSGSILALQESIVNTGCGYGVILVVFIRDSMNEDRQEQYFNAITDILDNINDSQSVFVCTKSNLYDSLFTETLISYPTTFKYVVLEKLSPTNVYNAVFGGKKISSKSAQKEIRKIIDKKEKEDDEPAVLSLEEDDDDEPVLLSEDDDEPAVLVNEETPNKKDKKQKKGLFSFFTKTKDKVIADSTSGKSKKQKKSYVDKFDSLPDAPSFIAEEDEDEPTLIDEEDSSLIEDEPTPIVEEETISSEKESTPMFNEDMFSDDEEDEEVYVKPDKKKKPTKFAPKVEYEEENVIVKQSRFSKPKTKLPKINNKQALSMQTQSKLVFVTGTGRIGQTSIVCSLGCTAALHFCSSLIVDLDVVGRGVSCLFSDYVNANSAESHSLMSSINSPHMIDSIAAEQFDNVYTVGVPLTEENNATLLDNITNLEIQTMLTQALLKFNLVVVDIPFEFLVSRPDLVALPHSILFCTSNDLMTIVGDLSNLTMDKFPRIDYYNILLSKLKFVLNMTQPENTFEGKQINSKTFSKVCSSITNEDIFKGIPTLANIPFLSDIGLQVEKEQPASLYNEEFAVYCTQILQNL